MYARILLYMYVCADNKMMTATIYDVHPLTTQQAATARHFAIEDKGRHTQPRALLLAAAREAL